MPTKARIVKAYEFGFKMGGFGYSVVLMSSLAPFFQDASAPLARESTVLFRLNKYF